MRLLLISRRSDGRLKRAGYLGTCLRVGLLVDLALEGRLHDDLNEFSIITTPTGFGPADALLAQIERQPDRSLAWWIGRGPSVRDPLAQEWVRLGVLARPAAWSWPRKSRYAIGADTDWSQAAADREITRLTGIVADAAADAPGACLASLAVLGGLIAGETRPSSELINSCGRAAWLLQATDSLIVDSEMRAATAREAAAGGG